MIDDWLIRNTIFLLSKFSLQENIKCLEISGWIWMLLTYQGPTEKFKGIIGQRILYN